MADRGSVKWFNESKGFGFIVPDDEAISKMVNTAIVEALKVIPESFTNAITEATKNAITKEDLATEMTTLTNSLVEKLGNKSTETTPKNKTKPSGPGNRFRGAAIWTEE